MEFAQQWLCYTKHAEQGSKYRKQNVKVKDVKYKAYFKTWKGVLINNNGRGKCWKIYRKINLAYRIARHATGVHKGRGMEHTNAPFEGSAQTIQIHHICHHGPYTISTHLTKHPHFPQLVQILCHFRKWKSNIINMNIWHIIGVTWGAKLNPTKFL